MIRRPPRSTRNDTLFPYTTLFRSKPLLVNVTGRMRVNNGELLRDAAVQGMGITYLPTFIVGAALKDGRLRSEEHTSELQSLMRISYAVFCLKKKIKYINYDSNDGIDCAIAAVAMTKLFNDRQ